MPGLNTLIRHKLVVFWAYAGCLRTAGVRGNYLSFITETKSIYLMKRLPGPERAAQYAVWRSPQQPAGQHWFCMFAAARWASF